MSDVTARLQSRVRNCSAILNRHSYDRDLNAARIVNRGVRYRRASVQEDDGAPAVDAASGEAFFFCGPVLRHRRSPVLASITPWGVHEAASVHCSAWKRGCVAAYGMRARSNGSGHVLRRSRTV